MSVRSHFVELGVRVGALTDAQLEAVGLDIMAEFGEITPTVDQLKTIVERHRNKPAPDIPAYIPSIPLRDLLDFEAGEHGSKKDRLIRECFDVSPARYVQLLNRALDDPEAMKIAPMLIGRLRRVRERRRELRWGVSA